MIGIRNVKRLSIVPLRNICDSFVKYDISDRIEDNSTFESVGEELRESSGKITPIRSSENCNIEWIYKGRVDRMLDKVLELMTVLLSNIGEQLVNIVLRIAETTSEVD